MKIRWCWKPHLRADPERFIKGLLRHWIIHINYHLHQLHSFQLINTLKHIINMIMESWMDPLCSQRGQTNLQNQINKRLRVCWICLMQIPAFCCHSSVRNEVCLIVNTAWWWWKLYWNQPGRHSAQPVQLNAGFVLKLFRLLDQIYWHHCGPSDADNKVFPGMKL